MNKGIAIGGPMDGIELCSKGAAKLSIPIQTGPDRGEGDRGFGAALYHWNGFNWIYGDATKH